MPADESPEVRSHSMVQLGSPTFKSSHKVAVDQLIQDLQPIPLIVFDPLTSKFTTTDI